MSAPKEWLQSSPTVWFIVFDEASKRHWWDRVLRTAPGFSHCYAVRWDGWNWIKFDPHAAFTDIAILPFADQNALARIIGPTATALEVEAFRPDRIRGRWWAGPMTCVEQIKALLGIQVGAIWTPQQLYRYLIETSEWNHGRPIKGANSRAICTADRAAKPPTLRIRSAHARQQRIA